MASGDRDGGKGAGKPRPEGAEAGAATAAQPDPEVLEISSRGRIVVRSSSHPPGETPPYSEPPSEPPSDSAPPAARIKRDTPAERPRGRRAARAMSPATGSERVVSPHAHAQGRGTTVLWATIVVLAAALAYALLR